MSDFHNLKDNWKYDGNSFEIHRDTIEIITPSELEMPQNISRSIFHRPKGGISPVYLTII